MLSTTPKKIEIKKEPMPTWLFFMLILLAFISGLWVGVVYGNIQCQGMYAEAVKNLSMANINQNTGLIEILKNISIS